MIFEVENQSVGGIKEEAALQSFVQSQLDFGLPMLENLVAAAEAQWE